MPVLSARSEATTRRTYNRPLDEAGSKFETWGSTVDRSHHDHHERLWEHARGTSLDTEQKAELRELTDLGYSRAGLVSGRTLWLGGTPYAYERAASQFNCSGLKLETVFDMVDAFWLLLNGCGVGGKPKAGTMHGYHRPITSLQVINSDKGRDHRGCKENVETPPTAENGWVWTIVFGDSAEAWAKGLGKLLSPPKGRVDRLVLSGAECRGPGGRLKGYGWICNGFTPLREALVAVHAILNRCAGNLLGEEDILDIFNWMGTILSSRRAAEAGLLDEYHPGVQDFAHRKHEYWLTGNDQRRQSNNSVMFWHKPSRKTIEELLHFNLDGGEPGFVNASAALRKCPWFDVFNPCATGDTLVAVADGRNAVRIDQLAKESKGKVKFNVYSARPAVRQGRHRTRWVPEIKSAVAFCTGVKQVGTVLLSNGDSVRLTADHKIALAGGGYVEASKSVGRVVEGFFTKAYKGNRRLINSGSNANRKQCRMIWEFSNGKKPEGYEIDHVINDAGDRLENLQLLTAYEHRAKTGAERLGDNNTVHRIKDRKEWQRKRLETRAKNRGSSGTVETVKKPNNTRWSKPEPTTVVSYTPEGKEPVYDLTVEDNHNFYVITSGDESTNYQSCRGLLVHNCFEIMLASHGFCNLVSLALPLFGRDFTRLERAVWVMARANYRQTCVDLRDGVLQPRWHQTNESLRLCGVSFTGIAQCPWWTDYHIRRLRNAAVCGANSMADELGLPQSKAYTTVKPEGTRSKITNWGRGKETMEGMHKSLGRLIFNWINFSREDPLVEALEAAGYKTIGNPSDVNNVLVRFPVDYGSGNGFEVVEGAEVNLEGAVEQLERYKRWNTLWADHNVSATISLDKSEVADVTDWIYRNWDDGYIATAFLQRTDPTKTARMLGHPYLPQEVVTPGQFEEATSRLKPVDWDRFHTGWYEIQDASDCPTGVCPVK